VLDSFLKKHGLQEGIHRIEIEQSWKELMGSMIASHTRSLTLRGGKLIVVLDSAPLRQELSFARTKMIDLLNEHLGKKVIREIEFR